MCLFIDTDRHASLNPADFRLGGKKIGHSIRVRLFVSLWFENWSHGRKQTKNGGVPLNRRCLRKTSSAVPPSQPRLQPVALCFVFSSFFFPFFWQQFSVFSVLCFASLTLCWRRWAGGSGTRSSALITCLLLTLNDVSCWFFLNDVDSRSDFLTQTSAPSPVRTRNFLFTWVKPLEAFFLFQVHVGNSTRVLGPFYNLKYSPHCVGFFFSSTLIKHLPLLLAELLIRPLHLRLGLVGDWVVMKNLL